MSEITTQFRLIKRLIPYLWSNEWGIRARFLIGIILILSAIAFNILVPLLFRNIINGITQSKPIHLQVEILLVFYGILWTLSQVTQQLRQIAMFRVIERGVKKLQVDIFSHLLKLSLGYHTGRKTGAIVNSINRASIVIPNLMWGLFFDIIPTIIEIFIAMFILIYLYGYQYGLTLVIILFFYLIFSAIGSVWSIEAQRKAVEIDSRNKSRIMDRLLGYDTIRSFVKQEYEIEQTKILLTDYENATIKANIRGEVILLCQGIIIGIGLTILLYMSGMRVLEGSFRVGDLALINGYLLQFMIPLGRFGFIFRNMNEGLTNLEAVITILDEKPEIHDRPKSIPLIVKDALISFDNVSFGYDPNRMILHELSFEIPAKKTFALVGPTGSGKSTIAKLLFRYYDISSGNIFIDGQDIRDVTQTSLQSAIGIVSQHTSLFNETLLHNIIYAQQTVSQKDIERVIEKTNLDLFIKFLPDGLNTMVGEHGFKLSGGERQRVAIARMLLKKAAVYVFDEATSSLDTKTEALILKNIEEISRHATTTLIIAHRLRTIINADQILVLDKGKIVEQGSHDQLIKQAGLYAQLWQKGKFS